MVVGAVTVAEHSREGVRFGVPISTVLVDDTPDIRMLLRLALGQVDGFEVVAEADDGAAGVDMVRHHQPDLVLLDLAMPVMDGLEALPLMLAASPRSRVVVLSGFESGRMQKAALAEGAAGYLQKGLPVDDLINQISDTLQPQRPPAVHVRAHDAPFADPEAELALLRSAMSIAAHEMRGSTYVIVGYANILSSRRASIDDATLKSMLDSITRQARVLDQQTRDLMAATQVQRGALTVDIRPLDLFAALESAVALLPDSQHVLVTCPVDVSVRADRVRLQQMLTNLLSNAIKYGDGEGGVRLVARPNGTDVEISVIDRGPGVPDAFRSSLFQQYTRAESLRANGTGLGLYVVKCVAEAQGGSVRFTPTSGGGATFAFTIPQAASS